MKKFIRAIASAIILTPALAAAAAVLLLINDMLNRLFSGQTITISSLLWLAVGCWFIYQMSRLLWTGWQQQPPSNTPSIEPEIDTQLQLQPEFKWTTSFRSIFKFLLLVFVGLPLLFFLLTGVFDFGSRLLGPTSIPLLLLGIPVVSWFGAKKIQALKISFEEKRKALEQNKWQGSSKKTTRLESVIRVILLIVLIPPLLIAFQGMVLSFPGVINSPFRSAIASNDLLGQAILTIISLVIFMPFLLIFLGLCWLVYKLASRLAHTITYVIGIQMEYKRLKEAMITPAIAQEEKLEELPKQQQAQR